MATQSELLEAAENKAALFLNGGACTLAIHPESTELDQLVMLRQLKLLHPHLSTHPLELEFRIRVELKKTGSKP